MKKKFILVCLMLSFTFFSLNGKEKKNTFLQPSDNFISNVVDGVKYEPGNWTHPNYSKAFRSSGNHRFVIKTDKNSRFIRVIIPWKRGDENPKKKGVVISDARTEKNIKNVFVKKINNEYGVVFF